jgi:hypothetical protein
VEKYKERRDRNKKPTTATRINPDRWEQPVQQVRNWLTTEQLRAGMRVASKGGQVYEVVQLNGSEYGISVHLTNMSTGRKSMVMIARHNFHKRLWKKADDWLQG